MACTVVNNPTFWEGTHRETQAGIAARRVRADLQHGTRRSIRGVGDRAGQRPARLAPDAGVVARPRLGSGRSSAELGFWASRDGKSTRQLLPARRRMRREPRRKRQGEPELPERERLEFSGSRTGSERNGGRGRSEQSAPRRGEL